MMEKRNNMKQAMYEMFGVGSNQNNQNNQNSQNRSAPPPPEPPAAEPVVDDMETILEEPVNNPFPVQPPVTPPESPVYQQGGKAPTSFLAAGTSFEGTLRSEGDVEIVGSFRGDITTSGAVMLRSNVQSNISAQSLTLSGCALDGDVEVMDMVSISENSRIHGNITAKELLCAGEITGDLRIAGNTSLESQARVNGNVTTGTVSVVRGAIINGSFQMSVPGDLPGQGR